MTITEKKIKTAKKNRSLFYLHWQSDRLNSRPVTTVVCVGAWPCHQRGGAGGSFFVWADLGVVFVVLAVGVVSLRFRFSRATSRVMTSTQPMALKSAKCRKEPWQSSSSSEEEAEASSSGSSVDSSSSVTNRLRSAHWASHACLSASDNRGSLSLRKEHQKNTVSPQGETFGCQVTGQAQLLCPCKVEKGPTC